VVLFGNIKKFKNRFGFLKDCSYIQGIKIKVMFGIIIYKKVKYSSKSTILRCGKCKHENIEWYNDQPGDKCLISNCEGRYFRENK
jgi:hypothetical protein